MSVHVPTVFESCTFLTEPVSHVHIVTAVVPSSFTLFDVLHVSVLRPAFYECANTFLFVVDRMLSTIVNYWQLRSEVTWANFHTTNNPLALSEHFDFNKDMGECRGQIFRCRHGTLATRVRSQQPRHRSSPRPTLSRYVAECGICRVYRQSRIASLLWLLRSRSDKNPHVFVPCGHLS